MGDTQKKEVDEQKACQEAFKTLNEYLTELEEELRTPMESNSTCERGVLNQHVERLEHMITKYALFITKNPNAETILPMTQELTNEVTAVTCLLRVLMQHAGPTLQAQLGNTGQQLVGGLRCLVEELQRWLSNTERDPQASDLPQWARAAVSFEFCKNIKKLPVTNAEAVGSAILRCVSLLKDASSELDELEEGDGKEEAVDEDDMLFCNDPLTHEEFLNATAAKELAKLTMTMTKKAYSFVLKLKTSDSDSKHVLWLECALRICKELTKWLDNLGESLYPPQEPPVVTGAFNTMVESLCELLDWFVEHDDFGVTFAQTFPKPKNGPAKAVSVQACKTWIDKVKEKARAINLPCAPGN